MGFHIGNAGIFCEGMAFQSGWYGDTGWAAFFLVLGIALMAAGFLLQAKGDRG